MGLDNWDDLKFVLAMKRHGTMSAAARFLYTNVATVSRRIDRISQELDVPLFEKRGQTFVPTHTADRLADLAQRIEQDLRTEIGNLHTEDHTLEVPLDIAAPPAVHSCFVLPRMDDLTAYLPHVRLTLTDKVFSQGLGGSDIQIRIGRPEGGRLKVRKYRDFSVHVYHGADHTLDGHWIGLSSRYEDADLLRKIYREANTLPRYRVEEMPLVYQMVCQTGLPGLLPDFLVQPSDGLVMADLEENKISAELWLAYHETRHTDSTLRAVVDWLCNAEGAAKD
ncbi:MAG: LysR family transcriptional regulator [Pseudomonadota bacterium]